MVWFYPGRATAHSPRFTLAGPTLPGHPSTAIILGLIGVAIVLWIVAALLVRKRRR